MQPLTQEDLVLINDLSARIYTGRSLKTNTNEIERIKFNAVKTKLRGIADYFANKYSTFYGPFQTNVSPEANPMTRGSTLNYVWSTLFKGAPNKQYAAQISFVVDRRNPCLNVGFYFGSASTHSITGEQKVILENTLSKLGSDLSNVLDNNSEMLNKYNSLFDEGFKAYIEGIDILPDAWRNRIRIETKSSRIVANISPNAFGIIENSIIDYFVSQIIFLMAGINPSNLQPVLKPLTPEQWAKKAERNAQIGLEGELFILKKEQEKLKALGINILGYPKHVALESNHFGFDILSLDSTENEIFIEVKTTTRKKEDPNSNTFFMSNNEYETYFQNKERYKLQRVFNIENAPTFKELDLENLTRVPNGYILTC